MTTNCIEEGQGLGLVEKTKSVIFEELRKRGFRITAQRKLIIDIILENKCSCCKEIYYEAVAKDKSIGIATVYRMLKLLEEVGAINRSNMYQIQCDSLECTGGEQIIFLGEDNQIEVIEEEWLSSIKQHLKEKGIITGEDISVVIRTKKVCEREELYYG